MKKSFFGNLPDGKPVYLYEMGDESFTVGILTYGATIQKVLSYGRGVVGGYDNLEAYVGHDSYQGAVIGRYANRIKEAKFELNGKTYDLEINCVGKHILHSASSSISRKLWDEEVIDDHTLRLTTRSADGESGFPGNVDFSVTYSVCGCELSIDYTAVSDADTPLNVTNHAYFNLDGFGGDILDHVVTLEAGHYSEIDGDLTPTGKLIDVHGTIFDFTTPHTIGERIPKGENGYDHNFVSYTGLLPSPEVKKIATAENADRRLTVLTDRPCVQFYIGNALGKGANFSGNIKQVRQGAFCFETQSAPYSVFSGEGILRAGDKFKSTTIFRIEKK